MISSTLSKSQVANSSRFKIIGENRFLNLSKGRKSPKTYGNLSRYVTGSCQTNISVKVEKLRTSSRHVSFELK